MKIDNEIKKINLKGVKMTTQANIANYMAPLVEQLKITNKNNFEHRLD